MTNFILRIILVAVLVASASVPMAANIPVPPAPIPGMAAALN